MIDDGVSVEAYAAHTPRDQDLEDQRPTKELTRPRLIDLDWLDRADLRPGRISIITGSGCEDMP